MLDNLIKFAQEHDVKNFLYVSSWVVHFPRCPLGASYLEMKRRCEQRLLQSEIVNPRIVRPSVVTGQGLSWTRILKNLSPFALLIPPRLSRSFVTIDEVCLCIDKIIDEQTHSRIVTCLGTRISLAEKAREYRSRTPSLPVWSTAGVIVLLILIIVLVFAPQSRMPIFASLGALFLVFLALGYTLPIVLGSLSDYFAGFIETSVRPRK